jgi:hypothetical protein
MKQWMVMAMLAGAVLFAGCRAQQRESADPLGAAPTDFSVEVSVMTGTEVPATAAHLRQCRYVLFADGSLFAGDDAAREQSADWLPPLTRVLTRRQVAEVWSLAQQLGFTNSQASHGAINFKTIHPAAGEVAYLASFRGRGQRWSFVRLDDPAAADPAMTEFVRALGRLAWASDALPAEVRVLPKRYDFGPDPYARFTQPGGAPAAAAATNGSRP